MVSENIYPCSLVISVNRNSLHVTRANVWQFLGTSVATKSLPFSKVVIASCLMISGSEGSFRRNGSPPFKIRVRPADVALNMGLSWSPTTLNAHLVSRDFPVFSPP